MLPIREKYKKTEHYRKLFQKCLVPKKKNWVEDIFDNSYSYMAYEPIARFILDEDEQIPAMVKYLRDRIDELESLKKFDPKIFK